MHAYVKFLRENKEYCMFVCLFLEKDLLYAKAVHFKMFML